MIQVLQLFGYLPNMLELSCNICTQRCEYCYAKTWKKCQEPIDKVMNDIIRKGQKKEGLLAFLIQNRAPITISNRTDIMCAPDWRERLYALKKMGFPIYLETKLNRDYRDLAQILDRKTDHIYQTITGWNNKYEEHNLLSAEEKIEAAKWLNEQGFHQITAVNPYMPDKCSVDDIKKMIDYIKPYGFVMRDYHTSSRTLDRKAGLFRDEYPKDVMFGAKAEVRKYVREKKVLHDIDDFQLDPYKELNLRIATNEESMGGNYFVFQKFLIAAALLHREEYGEDDTENDTLLYFDDFVDFYEKEMKFFEPCVIRASEYGMTNGRGGRTWSKPVMGIKDFCRDIWNYGPKLDSLFWVAKGMQDRDGNRVYLYTRREKVVNALRKKLRGEK